MNLQAFFNPYRKFSSRPFVVVDWVSTGVVLTQVTAKSGDTTFGTSHFLSWPNEQNPLAHPEETGQWLKSVCRELGLTSDLAAVSVPRRELSFKLIDLPNVPDDELGPLVSLQVELRTQTSGQDVAWDALHHRVDSPEATTRQITLATLPASTRSAMETACRAAGWSTVVLTSGDLLVGNQRTSDRGVCEIHAIANRAKLELLICRDDRPVASYATGMPQDGAVPRAGNSAAASIIQNMVTRLIAGLPESWQKDAAVAPLVCSGVHAEAVAQELRSLGLQTVSGCSDERLVRAKAVVRSLTKANDATLQRLDFLRPKDADGRAQKQRRRWVQIGVITAAVCLFGVVAGSMWKSSLEAELAGLQTERDQLQKYVDRGQEVLTRWKYVSDWKQNSLSATDEIRQVASKIPSRERLFVTRLQLDNVVDSETRTLRLEGLAQSPDDVLGLNQAILNASEHYDLRPQGIEPAPQGSSLPSQFRIEASLKTPSPQPEKTESAGYASRVTEAPSGASPNEETP